MVIVIAVAMAIVGVNWCPAVNLSAGALVSRLECRSLPDMPVMLHVHECNLKVNHPWNQLPHLPLTVV